MGSKPTEQVIPRGDDEAKALARAQAEQQLWTDAGAALNTIDRGTLALYKGTVEDALNQAYWRLRRRLYECGLTQHQVALLVRRHIHQVTEPR